MNVFDRIDPGHSARQAALEAKQQHMRDNYISGVTFLEHQGKRFKNETLFKAIMDGTLELYERSDLKFLYAYGQEGVEAFFRDKYVHLSMRSVQRFVTECVPDNTLEQNENEAPANDFCKKEKNSDNSSVALQYQIYLEASMEWILNVVRNNSMESLKDSLSTNRIQTEMNDTINKLHERLRQETGKASCARNEAIKKLVKNRKPVPDKAIDAIKRGLRKSGLAKTSSGPIR